MIRIAILTILFICSGIIWGDVYLQELLDNAQKHYIEGEQAQTLLQRKRAFNEALSAYMEASQHGSSDALNYAIGNTFYQLEEYPWAILYYTRALESNPRDIAAKQNLSLAREKLGLSSTESSSLMQEILSFHNLVSLEERKILFFLFSVASSLAASLFIWFRKRWLYQTAIVITCAAGLLLLNILITQYITPIEGIIIETTGLYSASDEQAPLVIREPLEAGNKVQIINVQDQGKWLKVIISGEHWGYIPYNSLRLI